MTVGCRREAAPPREPAGAPAADTVATAETLTVTGPTLVAGTSYTRAETDSGDASEAVGDFTTYFQDVQDSLPALGVALREANGSRITVKAGAVTYLWSMAADSERISYLFAVPGRRPLVRYGVMAGEDILRLVRDGLGWRDGENEWTHADAATVRLPPAAFPALPRALRARLDDLHCTVPQVSGDSIPHNVIHGHLRDAGSTDWAVLCSVGRRSRVLVFWSGRPDSMESLGETRDMDFLQGMGAAAIGFAHRIAIASPREILRYRAEFGDTTFARVDHDGIEDAFVGTASRVAYYDRGRWLTLQGAD